MKKLKRVFALTVLLVILCGSMAGITVSADYNYGNFEAVEYYLYGSINVHYHYKFFGVTFTLVCVALVFVGIWLYGRKIRKNELPKA